MRLRPALITFVFCAVLAIPQSSFAQELPKIGAGAKVSTLGIGFEAATAVTPRSNVRGGFNFFSYDVTSSSRGIDYDGSLRLRSIQVVYDQYLYRGLHVSPGMLLYNGNKAEAVASVRGGESFSLGDVKYFSHKLNPVSGTASFKLRKVAPMVLFGVGNLLPRNSRHLGFNFDFGVVFQGSPDVQLNLAGAACAVSATTACVNAATDPVVQSNLQREQERISDDLQPFKYYPVVSAGVSWKF
jgi:hypothetical protein